MENICPTLTFQLSKDGEEEAKYLHSGYYLIWSSAINVVLFLSLSRNITYEEIGQGKEEIDRCNVTVITRQRENNEEEQKFSSPEYTQTERRRMGTNRQSLVERVAEEEEEEAPRMMYDGRECVNITRQ